MMRSNGSRFAARAAILALTILVCVACQPKTQSGQVTITLTGKGGGAYSPAVVTVAVGTLVIFLNQDSQPHSATAPGAFDSGIIAPNGGRWVWVASVAGTFPFFSSMQPNMAGQITVIPATPTGQ
ncbi:MAG TPA: cupredoxin domain-containing protein [Candidatus Eremiobacteraceae bacterium]